MALTVLQMLMRGGGSFSAGGPRKGMYSRLCDRNEERRDASSRNHPKAIDIAAKELITVATPGQVDQVQLDRAKQSTKSAILMNLESRVCKLFL
ncbi:hypothetical protein LWI28_003109 [Acer negundo]|uniref:Uncharacterized protein n=1 Tax=Acer negundo TaxID=4023 RepID=A0AAD5NYE0_ACENE|nr:hypothetical protein LWI28_003109 [Acer negundo]